MKNESKNRKETYKTVQLRDSDKYILKKVCQILGKNQSVLLGELIKSIGSWLVPYERASLLIDDSLCRVTSTQNIIRLKIEGISPSPHFIHGVASSEEEMNKQIDAELKKEAIGKDE